MADIERLKDIACFMMSEADFYRDGVEVARAAYELQRLRQIVGNLPPSYQLSQDPDDD
jgi:hypothetical protein